MLDAVLEDFDELCAFRRLFMLHLDVVRSSLVPEGQHFLSLNPLLHVLNLIEHTNQLLLEEGLHVLGRILDPVVLRIDLAKVQLLLHELLEPLVVVRTVVEV